MTIGESIKNHRIKAGLTQKDLSDQLGVSFQTVSKWENDTNEPDLTTVKKMCQIFNCSIDDLINNEAECDGENSPALNDEENKDVHNGEGKETTTPSEPLKIQVGICKDCGKPLFSGDEIHHMGRRTESGSKETVDVCESCFQRHEELNRKKYELEHPAPPKKKQVGTGPFHKITDRNDGMPIIWGIIIAIVVFSITLTVCIINFRSVGLGWTIGLPILLGYFCLADIYCIFTASFISDVFMEVASWSVKFPGLIFTWDLDGVMWLIAMKITFAILGIMIGIGVFILALVISTFLSIFSFIPLLVYNKTHY